MSNNWVQDISMMHERFGVHEWLRKNKDNPELMKALLKFRLKFLQEELRETSDAIAFSEPEEVVDGLIDLCVVAIGTLDVFGIDAQTAWDEIHGANMRKEPGVKETRPNPLGLPDLIKPEGWTGPNHEGNHGYLPVAFQGTEG
jgi:hypothetical protein